MSRAERRALRVAIVGAGPRGTFALERLWHHLRAVAEAEPMQVDIFTAGSRPGSGAVYDPAQPGFLRMNFAADRIDMWPADSMAVPAAARRPFTAWNVAQSPARGPGGSALDAYPGRGQVGRYLADGFADLVEHTPDTVSLSLRPERADAIQRAGERWRVLSGARDCDEYDEVLLTAGHGTRLAGGEAAPLRRDGAVWLRSVFPVDDLLDPEAVPAGGTVAIRGFGLSFLDAALALTEGRGGEFTADGVRYRGTPDEVGRILPFSRTGRPVLAKPDPGLAGSIRGLADISGEGRDRLRAAEPPVSLTAEVLPLLAACGAAHLLAAHARSRHGEDARQATLAAHAWLEAACDGRPLPGADTPRAELVESIAVGSGRRSPGLLWALGETWRSVYPAVVERLGGAGIREGDQPRFRRLQVEMERIAFGPPLINATKLLALIAAGRVDLRYAAGGRLTAQPGATRLEFGDVGERVDAVVDAVLSGPGAESDGVLAQLVAEGHAHVPAGRRGIRTGGDGTCVRADGQLSAGLAVIGRATEDWVIGNDTLDRTLHPHLDHWAHRIVDRLVPALPAPAAPGLLAGGVR